MNISILVAVCTNAYMTSTFKWFSSITLVILLVLTAPDSHLFAQQHQYRFELLDVRNGLSGNQVNAIAKDEKGFMWFGTLSGLSRYDGYNFKVFRHIPGDTTSISDDYINLVSTGPNRTVCVLTRTGWNVFDRRTEKFTTNVEPILHVSKRGLVGIYKDKKQNFWYVRQGVGITRYNPSSNTKTDYNASSKSCKLFSDNVTSLSEDSWGNIWISYAEGILEKLDVVKNAIVFRSDVLKRSTNELNASYKLFTDSDGDLWIYCSGAEKGIFYYKPAANSLLAINKESNTIRLNANLVGGISEDDNGNIWVATDHGGINLINKKDLSIRYLLNNENDNKSLTQNSLSSIYKDDEGTMWLGTFKRGLNYFHKSSLNFPLFQRKPGNPGGLMYNDINAFAEDKKGNLWIGTNGGGLIYFNRASGTFKQYLHDPSNPLSLSNNVVVCLRIDKEDKLWVGTYFGGLNYFDGNKFIRYKHEERNPGSLADDRVWEIFEDSQNRLWVGTFQQGLELFDRKENRFIHHRPGSGNTVRSGYISSLMEDTNGDLWIGTAWGIDVLSKKTGLFRHFQHLENDKTTISHSNIISILQDSRGLIWVATKDGLNLYDREKENFKVYRTEHGLPDNTILTLVEDNNHNFWASTPNGLSNIIVSASANKQVSLQFKNYDETDGLQGRQFNENAAYKMKTGELIFGGNDGFNMFLPSKINYNKTALNLVVTDLQIFNSPVKIGEEYNGRVVLNESISEAKELTLNYNQNVFTIEFAALDFLNADKIKYAYTLEGFNSGWLTTDGRNRKAPFTNLDPGDYTLLVKASYQDGSWSKPLSLKIHILPPFWLTPFAYLLYALLFITALVFARKMTILRARQKFQIESERQEAHRLHELDMLKIKFFTNVSHEFRTPLSLIITPLEKIITQSAPTPEKKQFLLIHRNAKRLLNLVNQLLDFRKLEQQELHLNKTPGDILSFIKEVSHSFFDIAESKKIAFSFHSPQERVLTMFDHDKVERILFNLLSNAFKFTPVGGAVNVLVEVNESGNERTIQIKVFDSGIGIAKDKQEKIFDRFFQNEIPGSMVNEGSGIGLAIIKELIKLHGGTISVESEEDKGSCFTVTLPLILLSRENMEDFKQEDEELNDLISADNTLQPAQEEQKKGQQRRKTVLLVEDNHDFRLYIKENLESFYNVIEAPNGKIGWQKTLSEHPDLVVCDISMPEMNGIDLCKKINADSRTAFIPVILLTAMTGEDQQLAGLQTGASDYMTKPFNFEILLSKIKNLLSQQETFKKTYQKQVQVKATTVVTESADDRFIQQALEIIEKNISNTDFSVEEMSKQMFMSRVALYKRLFNLSGKTPIEFIRSIRLHRAAQLLEKNEFTVAEVAYEVGFNNPKYFTKYFKQEYSILPSSYAAEKKKEKS